MCYLTGAAPVSSQSIRTDASVAAGSVGLIRTLWPHNRKSGRLAERRFNVFSEETDPPPHLSVSFLPSIIPLSSRYLSSSSVPLLSPHAITSPTVRVSCSRPVRVSLSTDQSLSVFITDRKTFKHVQLEAEHGEIYLWIYETTFHWFH